PPTRRSSDLTDISAADGYFNARELVTAQLPEGLRSGYGRERGDGGPHRGKPPRRNRRLRGGERVHALQSRRCGASAINEFEARVPELPERFRRRTSPLDLRSAPGAGAEPRVAGPAREARAASR